MASSKSAEASAVVLVRLEEHTEESARAVQAALESRWAPDGFAPLAPLPGDWFFSVDTARPLRDDTVVTLAPAGSGDLLVRVRGDAADGQAQLAVAQVLMSSFHCTEATVEEVNDRRARDIVLRVDPQRAAGSGPSGAAGPA